MGSQYQVDRRIRIDAPRHLVQKRIADLRRWESWSPWEQLDPAQRRTYGGPDAGPGQWYEWDGNRKAGQGRMEIVAATDDHVSVQLRFLRPFKAAATSDFRLSDTDGATEVVWTITGENSTLMRLFGVFLSMEKMLGSEFEKGLAALKAESEAAAAAG